MSVHLPEQAVKREQANLILSLMAKQTQQWQTYVQTNLFPKLVKIYALLYIGFFIKVKSKKQFQYFKISYRNKRSTRFLFHLLVMLGNYEPTCIVTIKMGTM